MKVIPAIDLRAGNCVRLYQGEFDKETQYSDDPAAIARGYRELACSDLHVVDLDGAQTGDQRNRELVRGLVADSGFAVQLGGGIRDRQTVQQWFDAGVQRVVIGSVAVTDPATVARWMQDFGPERLVLALDCRCDADGVPWLTTHGWTRQSGVTLWDRVEDFRQAGLQHVLCTDVSRDGAMTGPSLTLYREFIARFPEVALQASGGVRNLGDLEALRATGAAAAITGRALLDGCISAAEVASFRPSA